MEKGRVSARPFFLDPLPPAAKASASAVPAARRRPARRTRRGVGLLAAAAGKRRKHPLGSAAALGAGDLLLLRYALNLFKLVGTTRALVLVNRHVNLHSFLFRELRRSMLNRLYPKAANNPMTAPRIEVTYGLQVSPQVLPMRIEIMLNAYPAAAPTSGAQRNLTDITFPYRTFLTRLSSWALGTAPTTCSTIFPSLNMMSVGIPRTP